MVVPFKILWSLNHRGWKECHWNIRSQRHANLGCFFAKWHEKKNLFIKRIFWNEENASLHPLFWTFWVLWCSLSRQEAWKGCIQYKCFICKTICRAEERRKSSCKPQKKSLKENASEKSRFLQKCTFYCFSSLSLFAGINQSIIKPFPTMIRWNHQLSRNQASKG